MAFELITGHAGRNHVDSADMGEAFAGIVGKGRYILDTGEGMACAMTDSNTLTVGTGSMLMDGRIVRNETAATFRIANGTQGQYRHDLACLRYTLDRSNDSIESVEQVVLQGTPATTASEAKDPEYEAGDILFGDLSATVPIARVKLDNLTPTCEAMLGSVTSLKSLGDSVSHVVRSVTFSANHKDGTLYYGEFDTDIKARNFVLAFPLSGVRFIRPSDKSSAEKQSWLIAQTYSGSNETIDVMFCLF